MKIIRTFSMLILVLAMWPGSATAQETDDEVLYGTGAGFARLAVVEGSATVTREGEEPFEAVINLSIEPMDRLATNMDGRAVIQFVDGSFLKLDETTQLEFLEIGSLDETTTLAFLGRMWNGSVFLDISDDENFPNRSFRLDTEDSTIYFLSSGKYRVDKIGSETRVKVISGSAEVANGTGSQLVHSGEVARSELGRSAISKSYFNTFDMDNFDLWALNNHRRTRSASADYVPAEVTHYASELDSYGTWYYDTALTTYVWRPHVVVHDWTPYSHGYWNWSPYGMSWVSYYPWGYAPFHYGAWDWSVSFGWVWVPGRYYSPGWVTWCSWDSYVGWYPYNRHHWHRYHRHRGHVARHYPRGRVVYARDGHLGRRSMRVATRDLPQGRTITRVNRPITPDRGKLTRNPSTAIREAVNRPVSRTTVNNRQTVVRERSITTLNRGVSVERNTTTRTTVRNPQVRTSERGATRTIRTPSGSSGGKIIRRSTTSTGVTSRSITTRKPVIRSERSTVGSSNRTVTRKPITSSTTRSIKPRTNSSSSRTVTPRSSSTPSRSIKPRSNSSSRTIQPRSNNSSRTITPRSNSASRTITPNRNSSNRSGYTPPSRSYSPRSTRSTTVTRPRSSTPGRSTVRPSPTRVKPTTTPRRSTPKVTPKRSSSKPTVRSKPSRSSSSSRSTRSTRSSNRNTNPRKR